jgi:tight adherence protein B
MTTAALGYLAIALVAGGLAATTWIVARDPDSGPRGYLARYTARLEAEVSFLMLERSADQILRLQFLAMVVGVSLAIFTGKSVFILLCLLVAVGPLLWLRRRTTQRRARIEEQLDGWLLMLANMLKATGSLGDALQATVSLTAKPIADEVDLVVKQVKFGTPLDQALRQMAERIGSPIVGASLTGLIVARNTGGDLPSLLERSASSLREIARVEGVVRSQTSQGKMQLMVMALFPVAIYCGLRMLDPHFFDPLTGLTGTVIYAAAILLWIGGVVLARKILDVDV